MTTYTLIAEDAPAGKAADGKGQPEGGMWSMLLPLVLMLVVFYFILIRPQRTKEKERQKHREEMLKNLRKNDHVMTIGGLHGIVASVTDEEVVLKADEKNDVRLRFTRDAISKVIGKEGDAGENVQKPGEKLEEKN